MVEILNTDYGNFVTVLGTAHFTRRSLIEAVESVQETKLTDLAVELDLRRFTFLDLRCNSCVNRLACSRRCEFIGASDAVGNLDMNIWLIDMSEKEISQRIGRQLPYIRFPLFSHLDPFHPPRFFDEERLWEEGQKREVMNRHKERLRILRARAPHVWRVLIDERNALMASRLAWIASRKLAENMDVRILALTGAAHVEGITALLKAPWQIGDEMKRLNLKFSPPKLIRRVGVN
jgi:pheromone shutdown protein TraB